MKRAGNYWLPDADQHFIECLEKEGGFQLDRLRKAIEFVTDFSLAIDGGAHVGSWSKTMLNWFNKVVAFEPAPDTFECLERNLWSENRLGKADLHNKALGDQHAHIVMDCDQRYEVAGNTGARYVRKAEEGEVEMVTIDSLKLPSLGFLKLDVEGAEYLALKGAEETLRHCHPVVFIEVKKDFGERFGVGREAPIKFLKELGAREVARIKSDHVFTF